jgi:hypothetical protein
MQMSIVQESPSSQFMHRRPNTPHDDTDVPAWQAPVASMQPVQH